MSESIDSEQRSWTSQALAYLRWFYLPLGKPTVSDIYDLVSTNSYSDEGLYLNLGYWKNASHIDDACKDLARLCADHAQLGPEDDVLDVGFGFGDQDIMWVKEYDPRSITGVNITESQVKLAKSRVCDAGLDDRINLLQGSATSLEFEDNSFDCILAVECAFHFDTREDFFREALRVLRPGGRLVLADVIRNGALPGRFERMMQNNNWNFFCSKYCVPKENSDYPEDYVRKLEKVGFTNVDLQSIRDQVYPKLHAYMAADPSMLKRFHLFARLPYKLSLFFDHTKVYSPYDYVLVRADKNS